MRDRFTQQMEKLHVELIEMGALCEQAISRAYQVLMEEDPQAAQDLRKKDAAIDEKEREIESRCLKLLLQQQPVASDLRQISSALKMISDMERIGDQAQDIAGMSKFVQVQEIAHTVHVGEMAEATIKMVTESIDSFVKKNIETARNVVKYDDVVDNLFLQVKEELTGKVIDDSKNAEYYLDLIMIAKYFERIGDHAENIAQWVEYSITGEHDDSEQE